MLAIPFIVHIEKKLSLEDAQKIAAILGLPVDETNYIHLSIDDNLCARGFARGLSVEKPMPGNAVPYMWLAMEEHLPEMKASPLDLIVMKEDETVDLAEFVGNG